MMELTEINKSFVRSSGQGFFGWIHREFAEELTSELLARMSSEHSLGSVPEVPGRGKVKRGVLPSGRALIVRNFLRGGWVRYLSQELYFRPACAGDSNYRPFQELIVLEHLRQKGVLVPKPVAALVWPRAFGLVYRGLIATEELEGAENLLSLLSGGSSMEVLAQVSRQAGLQAGEMLQAGIYHVDLHLGNVIAAKGEVYLIDFDKAVEFSTPSEVSRYAVLLERRWRRSVLKHEETSPNAKVCEAEFVEGLKLSLSGKH